MMNSKQLRQINKKINEAVNSDKELHCEIVIDIDDLSTAKYFLGDEEITEDEYQKIAKKRKHIDTNIVIEYMD